MVNNNYNVLRNKGSRDKYQLDSTHFEIKIEINGCCD